MEQRPKARIRAVPIFAKLDKLQLHRIASAAVSSIWHAGDTIVTQGDVGDAMYIIDHGRCNVIVNGIAVHSLSDGDSFGELSLLSDEARSASIVAISTEVACMVLNAALIRPILEQYLGKGELDKREVALRRVPLFASLARGELRRLATQLECVQFPDAGFAIITEGQVGNDMFVLSAGNCEAFTEGHGRVKEYGPGDIFGELGVVDSAVPRKATVRTVPSKVGAKTTVECLRLLRKDVARILSGDIGSVRDAMSSSVQEYRRAVSLKTSDIVAASLRKFWHVMIGESELLRQRGGSVVELVEGCVTREAYEQMHLRVSKSLGVGFDLQAAKHSANQDWAEDITAFSGDTGVSIWLEEVKKKFKVEAARVIGEGSDGWEALFKAYDEDGSGQMEFGEFHAAVRGDCNISKEVVSDGELRELFSAVDKDDSGDIDLREFVDFLESDPLAADMTFKVFAEAMQQLAQLWVGKAEESQHAKFLDAIFDNITTRDGQLRDVITDGANYRLAALDEIESMVSAHDNKVHIDGVDINDVHSVTGKTPAELEEIRRHKEEAVAKHAMQVAKRQEQLDVAAQVEARRQAEEAIEAAENQVLADAAAAEGTQSPLRQAEMAEIRRRQKQQRELRIRQAKRRNGVLRSNAETARNDFKKKKAPETIGLLINGREKLGPDGKLLKKGEVDPHILDMHEMCLFSPQPLRRSARKLYSDPVLSVTRRAGEGAGMDAVEAAELKATESSRDCSRNVKLWIGHKITDLGETKGPTLSVQSDAGGDGGSLQPPRLTLRNESSSPTLTRDYSFLDVVNSPRLPRSQAPTLNATAQHRLRSSAATGVGNGSAAYRAMVEGMRKVAHTSKLMQLHPAQLKRRQHKRGKASAKNNYVRGEDGWSTERGTVSSVRSGARAVVSSTPHQAQSARERGSRKRFMTMSTRPRPQDARTMYKALGGAPKRFL